MPAAVPDERLIDDICAAEPATAAAALQAAAPHRETLAPVLLARLLQASMQPQLWTGNKGQPCPVFLAYLAAAWRLTDAHPRLIALVDLQEPACRRFRLETDCRKVVADFHIGDRRRCGNRRPPTARFGLSWLENPTA